MNSDIQRFTAHLAELEHKHVEAKQHRDRPALELRALMAEIDKNGDNRLVANQSRLNKQIAEAGRLVLSLDSETKEARKRLEMAEAQRAEAARIEHAAEVAGLPRDRLFEVEAPDHRLLRHRANSYDALQRVLLPNYSIRAEIFGFDPETNEGGFVCAIGAGQTFMQNLLAAHGGELRRWLASSR